MSIKYIVKTVQSPFYYGTSNTGGVGDTMVSWFDKSKGTSRVMFSEYIVIGHYEGNKIVIDPQITVRQLRDFMSKGCQLVERDNVRVVFKVRNPRDVLEYVFRVKKNEKIR